MPSNRADSTILLLIRILRLGLLVPDLRQIQQVRSALLHKVLEAEFSSGSEEAETSALFAFFGSALLERNMRIELAHVGFGAKHFRAKDYSRNQVIGVSAARKIS